MHSLATTYAAMSVTTTGMPSAASTTDTIALVPSDLAMLQYNWRVVPGSRRRRSFGHGAHGAAPVWTASAVIPLATEAMQAIAAGDTTGIPSESW